MSEEKSNIVQFMTREEFEAMDRTLRGIANGDPKVTKITKKEMGRQFVIDSFNEAFYMIGGVQRFALWAHENPSEFYKLWGKQLPSGAQVDVNASGEIIFKHVLPPSKLDHYEDSSNG